MPWTRNTAHHFPGPVNYPSDYKDVDYSESEVDFFNGVQYHSHSLHAQVARDAWDHNLALQTNTPAQLQDRATRTMKRRAEREFRLAIDLHNSIV